jgi:hypothetical protein
MSNMYSVDNIKYEINIKEYNNRNVNNSILKLDINKCKNIVKYKDNIFFYVKKIIN